MFSTATLFDFHPGGSTAVKIRYCPPCKGRELTVKLGNVCDYNLQSPRGVWGKETFGILDSESTSYIGLIYSDYIHVILWSKRGLIQSRGLKPPAPVSPPVPWLSDKMVDIIIRALNSVACLSYLPCSI